MQRRQFLSRTGAAVLAGSVPWAHAQQPPTAPSPAVAEPFDFERLQARATALAARPYQPRPPLPDAVAALSEAQYRRIAFRDDRRLWSGAGLPFTVGFFHRGSYFRAPVQMYEVSDGLAREIAFDPALFDYDGSGLAAGAVPGTLGFAGLRLYAAADPTRDIASFLGASYFRAVGSNYQFGLSARGVAVDTALASGEEFPDFVAFWLERPAPGASACTLYALLDGPSVAGAYRFVIRPGEPLVMDVTATLVPRTIIARLGLAALTSMYQYGENDRRMAWDWRPEVHDSDGLQLWSSNGEWLWRPLANPRQLAFSTFRDAGGVRGFGLMQRDRDFDHYQDTTLRYERRPSLWVEPAGDWGDGAVDLVEIPTTHENFDNIVAFWEPATAPRAGAPLALAYRLFWGERAPVAPPLAQCIATRTGDAAPPGQGGGTPAARRFVVDFAGPPLQPAPADTAPDLGASRGQAKIVASQPLAETNGWRVTFDLLPDGSAQPVELRLALQSEGRPLSETWLYRWTPPATAATAGS